MSTKEYIEGFVFTLDEQGRATAMDKADPEDADYKQIMRERNLAYVRNNGLYLQYVQDQTPEMCLVAVNQNGRALEYVKEQTEEVCLEAVKENGNALAFVRNQTPEICRRALKHGSYPKQYIKI